MNRYRSRLALVLAAALSGCDADIRGYSPASSVAEGGFARSEGLARKLHGHEIALWGFVDQGNLYGDGSVKRILGDWWSGDGPSPTTWRFNLKSHGKDPVGHSFPVRVPNDRGRDALLQSLVADARAHKPTRVYAKGKIFVFDAPTNLRRKAGLYMELGSSLDVRLAPPTEP